MSPFVMIGDSLMISGTFWKNPQYSFTVEGEGPIIVHLCLKGRRKFITPYFNKRLEEMYDRRRMLFMGFAVAQVRFLSSLRELLGAGGLIPPTVDVIAQIIMNPYHYSNCSSLKRKDFLASAIYLCCKIGTPLRFWS